MSLVNKSGDMTPFDMKQKPSKQKFFLLPVIWGASFVMTRKFGLKIEKVNMNKARGPYLVLATHQGFMDYCIGPLSLFPRRAMYVSDMEGFAAFGKALYRGIGCIGKRRYVSDINVMIHIRDALKSGQSVVIYPESRHSNIGVTADIPLNMGRLVKKMDVPLVILSAHGSYLANPFWNEEKTRKVPITAKLECVLDKEEIESMNEESIQKIIEDKLAYDEYAYQHKKGFLIKDKDRAEGLELPLFQCRTCKTKYNMRSEGSHLFCGECGRKWNLSENGWLISEEGGEKIHLPDWYSEEKEFVSSELAAVQHFKKKYDVTVEALPNEKGFVPLGAGRLFLDTNEFLLEYDYGGEKAEKHFQHKIRESVQTEYNYRGKGKCIVLSDRDCCYYIYSEQVDFQPTEIQFIGEYFYRKEKNNLL